MSDDHYRIVALPASSGQRVKQDETLSVLETSKATFEITSPEAGYVFYNCSVGDRVPVGGLLAVISDSAKYPTEYLESNMSADHSRQSEGNNSGVPRISAKAQRLMEKHGLDASQFAHLAAVRTADVERFLADSQCELPRTAPPLAQQGIERVLLLGGGGHSKMCIDILRQSRALEIVGIFDGQLPPGSEVLGVPVIGVDSDENLAAQLRNGTRHAVNAVGATHAHQTRAEIYERISKIGFALPNLIHPSAVIEPSAQMGSGNQIMANATVGSDVRIGDNCIINSGSVVSHGTTIGNHVHIAPGAVLAGDVSVGENTLIGMGVTVFLGVTIGAGVCLTNGSHVFKDVPSGHSEKHRRARHEGADTA